jgi:hypothetical protein
MTEQAPVSGGLDPKARERLEMARRKLLSCQAFDGSKETLAAAISLVGEVLASTPPAEPVPDLRVALAQAQVRISNQDCMLSNRNARLDANAAELADLRKDALRVSQGLLDVRMLQLEDERDTLKSTLAEHIDANRALVEQREEAWVPKASAFACVIAQRRRICVEEVSDARAKDHHGSWWNFSELGPWVDPPVLPPSEGVDVPRARVNPDELTILLAQKQQPWSVPYGAHKWWVTNGEGRLKHCLAHAQKTLGKIAEIAERLDHADRQWLLDEECDAVGDMAADLVSAALQLGTTVSRSVAHALVRRVTAKNGVALDPKGGTYGRTLICT